MKVFVLYNDIKFNIEQVSCDRQKIYDMAQKLNKDNDLELYYVCETELHDMPHGHPECHNCHRNDGTFECLHCGKETVYSTC